MDWQRSLTLCKSYAGQNYHHSKLFLHINRSFVPFFHPGLQLYFSFTHLDLCNQIRENDLCLFFLLFLNGPTLYGVATESMQNTPFF